MTLRSQSLAATGLLVAALARWVVAFRGMSMMGGLGPFREKALPGGERLAGSSVLALVASGAVVLA